MKDQIPSNKKAFFISVIIVLLIYVILFFPLGPSKTQLCNDLGFYIEKKECNSMKYKYEIIFTAFPIGITTKDEIHKSIGKYTDHQFKSNSGEEYYYIIRSPIDYFFPFIKESSIFVFYYDENDILEEIIFD